MRCSSSALMLCHRPKQQGDKPRLHMHCKWYNVFKSAQFEAADVDRDVDVVAISTSRSRSL